MRKDGVDAAVCGSGRRSEVSHAILTVDTIAVVGGGRRRRRRRRRRRGCGRRRTIHVLAVAYRLGAVVAVDIGVSVDADVIVGNAVEPEYFALGDTRANRTVCHLVVVVVGGGGDGKAARCDSSAACGQIVAELGH